GSIRVRLPAWCPVLQKPLTYRHFQRFGHCRPGATQGTLLGLPERGGALRRSEYFPAPNHRLKIRSKRMALERTLSIVKPDGVRANLIGEVYRRFEQAGLSIVAARMLHLSQREAEGFYAVHRERPFFKDLVRFMTSGPVLVPVLAGEGGVALQRDIMGGTDTENVAAGS